MVKNLQPKIKTMTHIQTLIVQSNIMGRGGIIDVTNQI